MWVSDVFFPNSENNSHEHCFVFRFEIKVIQPFNILNSARSLLTWCSVCPHLQCNCFSFWNYCSNQCLIHISTYIYIYMYMTKKKKIYIDKCICKYMYIYGSSYHIYIHIYVYICDYIHVSFYTYKHMYM